MKIKHLLFTLSTAAFFLSACQKSAVAPAFNSQVSARISAGNLNKSLAITQTFDEGFESGSKTAYADASVTFTSGSWDLNDALIGTSTSDAKTGTKSVRIRNTGTLGMNFDVSTGASTVTLSYAVYGSDGSSAFQLWVSSNGGSSYTEVGTTSVTASSTSLATATFTVNQSGSLRFQLRKTTGGTNRINIDEFTINSFDSSSGGGGTGGGSTADNTNLLLGNPSGATSSITNADNYLIDQTYYTESYNRDKGEPNWVSWYVGSTTLGSESRANDFRADTNLPTGWYEVQATSYSGSGFDRGHNCPSGDRTSTTAANEATFLMDNMIPQAPKNNEQTWASLEEYGRSLVSAGSEIYVIMGSYGSGGTGSAGSATTINSGNVVVPSNIWKVIVVIPNGNNDLSRITSSTRVIAVNTPNINTISTDWTQYITTVQAIETATGYSLLTNLPAAVRAALETKKDAGAI
ncbi:DNA/RNA non-specific endonuclease [Mucilaginibacter sp. BJC16-A38]|uniref:DNA/RNA non-specific endonuclease n=1 Tax=Mucilaginibacter phenanthrenivorans TaxID=1234842 RepID=UPI0021578DF1|nr:DNA/RNA non-specific endonuclease [Mucilaginibacter phenanthrenivorans]MCR8560851.1 DNA/RNA non-specific endonuclease [Mucilaginibacter phenanthrenivorans]